MDLNAQPDAERPRTDEELHDNISAVVNEMLAARHIPKPELAAALDISPVTLAAKLRPGGGRKARRFTVPEIFKLAEFFGTSTDAFYRPVEGLRAELTHVVQNWKILGDAKTKLTIVPPLPTHELPLEWGAESASNPHPRNLRIVSQ